MDRVVSLILLFACVSGVLGKAATEAGSTKANEEPWVEDYRLPSTTYPNHYDLYLHPDLTAKTYTGKVTIHITSSEARDYFLVHTKLNTISDTKLVKVDGENRVDVNIVDAFEELNNEFWVVKTDLVDPGDFELSLTFNGSLAGKIIGFYYSEYTTPTNETRPLATSKFQPTYARQAFPCFDEPSFRSTFSITLVRPSQDYIGLSNMPVMTETADQPSAGLTEVAFEKSVSMVSYLVVFIVCDFTYLETHLHNETSTPFRVYAPADRISKMQYAMDFGAATLNYYEEFFSLPFPLPKSDMAAIPDYPSGATEHWGLVTYRETRVLYDSSASSTQDYQSLTSTISHELAHQWFGNMVTLQWWNDLWLNEGFASYIQFKGVDNYHPSWDMPAQFVDEPQTVMVFDSKLSSHPIVQPVDTPDEITAVFDVIAYNKGASVLKMLETLMGETYFKQGITNFLEKYKYSNAITQNLWDELTAVWAPTVPEGEKNDIGVIMDTWTAQMGYPIISVTKSGTTLTLTQKRFLQDPRAVSNDTESPYAYIWDVPITILTGNNTDKAWLYKEMPELTLELANANDWFKLNPGQNNYYRVNYEPQVWNQLAELCSTQTLGAADRANLYDDILAIADAGLIDYSVALDFTKSLGTENHVVPWKSAATRLSTIDTLLLSTTATAPYKTYMQSLCSTLFSTLGWDDGGSHLESLLRYTISDVACWSGDASCLEQSGVLLQSWIDDVNYALPLDTRRKVLWWGMIQSGSNANWDIMWSRCLAETDATQRTNLYYALSNSQDTSTLSSYIELAFDENNVKSQDFLNVLIYISYNPTGTDLVWDWVRTNWERLVDRYTLNDRYLGRMVGSITESFSTQEKLDEMNAFFTEYPEAGAGEQYRKQALETVEYNIFWVSTYSNQILDWLNSNTL